MVFSAPYRVGFLSDLSDSLLGIVQVRESRERVYFEQPEEDKASKNCVNRSGIWLFPGLFLLNVCLFSDVPLKSTVFVHPI